jgi:hypothetical protein
MCAGFKELLKYLGDGECMCKRVKRTCGVLIARCRQRLQFDVPIQLSDDRAARSCLIHYLLRFENGEENYAAKHVLLSRHRFDTFKPFDPVKATHNAL